MIAFFPLSRMSRVNLVDLGLTNCGESLNQKLSMHLHMNGKMVKYFQYYLVLCNISNENGSYVRVTSGLKVH